MLWNVRKRCNNYLYLSCQSFQSPDDDMNTTRKRSCPTLLSELEKLEEFPQLIWHFHAESGPFLVISWDFWWLCLFWLGILLWNRIKSKIWPSHTSVFWIFVQYFSGCAHYLRLLLSSPDPSTKFPWSSWSGPYFPPLLTLHSPCSQLEILVAWLSVFRNVCSPSTWKSGPSSRTLYKRKPATILPKLKRCSSHGFVVLLSTAAQSQQGKVEKKDIYEQEILFQSQSHPLKAPAFLTSNRDSVACRFSRAVIPRFGDFTEVYF